MRANLSPLIATVATSLIAATPAFANDDAISRDVMTADLDLSSSVDIERLHSRLARAARTVCREPGTRGVQAGAAYTRCRSDALSKANLRAERAIAAAAMRNRSDVQTAGR